MSGPTSAHRRRAGRIAAVGCRATADAAEFTTGGTRSADESGRTQHQRQKMAACWSKRTSLSKRMPSRVRVGSARQEAEGGWTYPHSEGDSFFAASCFGS